MCDDDDGCGIKLACGVELACGTGGMELVSASLTCSNK